MSQATMKDNSWTNSKEAKRLNQKTQNHYKTSSHKSHKTLNHNTWIQSPLPQGPAEGQEPVLPNPSGYDHIDENSISSRGKEILALLPMKKCKGKERPYCCFYITPGKLKRSPGFKSMEALAEALAEWEAQGGPDFSHRIKLD